MEVIGSFAVEGFVNFFIKTISKNMHMLLKIKRWLSINKMELIFWIDLIS